MQPEEVISRFFRHVVELTSNNRVADSLGLLQGLYERAQQRDWRDNVVNLKRRFAELRKERESDTISDKEYSQGMNQLCRALVNLTDLMQQEITDLDLHAQLAQAQVYTWCLQMLPQPKAQGQQAEGGSAPHLPATDASDIPLMSEANEVGPHVAAPPVHKPGRRIDSPAPASQSTSDDAELKKMFADFELDAQSIEKFKEKNFLPLFDVLIGLDKLGEQQMAEIQALRYDRQQYGPQHRALAASALSLSLLYRFAPEKAHLLLDLVFDHEDETWQRALCGLALGLCSYDKRIWAFHHLTQRLRLLKHLPEAQEALWEMNDILTKQEFGTYRMDVAKFPGFYKEAQNWFLPFYPENPVMKAVLNDTHHNLDTETFAQLLLKSERLYQVDKYIFCLGLNSQKPDALQKMIDLYLRETDWQSGAEKSPLRTKLAAIITELHEFTTRFADYRRDERSGSFEWHSARLLDTDLILLMASDLRRLSYQADGHYLAGRHQAAIAAYQELLAQGQASLDLYTRISTSYMKLGQNPQALPYMLKGLELAPNNAPLLENIAWVYQLLEDYEKAIQYHLRLQAQEPQNAWNLRNMGYCYLQQGKYAEALPPLQEAEQNHAADAWTLGNLAFVHMQLEHYPEAAQFFQQANQLQPNNAWVLRNLGFCLLKLGHYDQALAPLQQAEQLQPGHAWNHDNLGYVLMQLGQYAQAIAQLASVVQQQPNNDRVLANLGYCLMKNQDYDGALAHLLKSDELEPTRVWNLQNIAYTLHKQGKYEEAIGYLMRANQQQADDPWTLSYWGYMLMQTSKHAEALPMLRKAHELSPADGWILGNLASCIQQVEGASTALPYWQQAQQLQATDPWANEQLCLCHQQLGQYREALAVLEKLGPPEQAANWALPHLAYCHEMLQEWPQALDYYRRSLALNPDDSAATCGVMLCLFRLENYTEVANMGKQAQKAHPDDAWIANATGAALFRLGHVQQSRTQLRRAAKISPNFTHAWQNLGDTYLCTGPMATAMRHYYKALDSIESQEAYDEFVKDLNDLAVQFKDRGATPQAVAEALAQCNAYWQAKKTNASHVVVSDE